MEIRKGDLIQIWDWTASRPEERIYYHGQHAVILGIAKKDKYKLKVIREGDVFRVLTTSGEHVLVHRDNMKGV